GWVCVWAAWLRGMVISMWASERWTRLCLGQRHRFAIGIRGQKIGILVAIAPAVGAPGPRAPRRAGPSCRVRWWADGSPDEELHVRAERRLGPDVTRTAAGGAVSASGFMSPMLPGALSCGGSRTALLRMARGCASLRWLSRRSVGLRRVAGPGGCW